MLFHLLAVVAVGAGVGLMVWAPFRTVKRKPPRYLIPGAVGLSMLAYNIWDEYSWAGRFKSELPARIQVVREVGKSSFWQPWTYLAPRVVRLIAVDRATVARNPSLPGYVMGDLILAERQGPTLEVHRLADCAGARFADLPPDVAFDARGMPVDVAWYAAETGDAVQAELCGGIAEGLSDGGE